MRRFFESSLVAFALLSTVSHGNADVPCTSFRAEKFRNVQDGRLISGEQLVKCVRFLKLRAMRLEDNGEPPLQSEYRAAVTDLHRSLFVQLPQSWKAFLLAYRDSTNEYSPLPGAERLSPLSEVFERVDDQTFRFKDGLALYRAKLKLNHDALNVCIGLDAVAALGHAAQEYSVENPGAYEGAKTNVLKIAGGLKQLAAEYGQRKVDLDERRVLFARAVSEAPTQEEKSAAVRSLNVATQRAQMEGQREAEALNVASQYVQQVDKADRSVQARAAAADTGKNVNGLDPCDQGDAKACFRNAVKEPNTQKRGSRFKRACELGSGWGCNNLGDMYSRGQLGKQDLESARKYFGEACRRGLEHGCANLRLIAPEK